MCEYNIDGFSNVVITSTYDDDTLCEHVEFTICSDYEGEPIKRKIAVELDGGEHTLNVSAS
ncbi:TPA: hypothetical protein I7257_02180 [Vibrio vulnificus]|uniref:Uncharacterized protein n=1 Tax=Photobacterium ganghwense TaxID=320778 RepID=A0A0J1H8R0_9GAMM|nr:MULTISPECIES: hypothetical protein [Vibrionaceae]EME0810866.1 hypothetical protein [Vibrio vulnificus]KLV08140.1 hypothetical protein ABT57_15095 [Photobacterium ganghwense]WED62247.1 hypothetical protein O6P42_18050 [Vibrio alginolyticus]HAS6416452.1 hypothetical protein [Vibrio vulnificus]